MSLSMSGAGKMSTQTSTRNAAEKLSSLLDDLACTLPAEDGKDSGKDVTVSIPGSVDEVASSGQTSEDSETHQVSLGFDKAEHGGGHERLGSMVKEASTAVAKITDELDKGFRLVLPQLQVLRQLEAELHKMDCLQRLSDHHAGEHVPQTRTLSSSLSLRILPGQSPSNAGLSPPRISSQFSRVTTFEVDKVDHTITRDDDGPQTSISISPRRASIALKTQLTGKETQRKSTREVLEEGTDVEEIKRIVRKKTMHHVTPRKERLEEAMNTTGLCQFIVRSHLFETTTFTFIVLYALWMSIDADWNGEELLANADVGFQLVEHVFCLYFLWEWAVRLLAYKKKLECLKDHWFVIDSFLLAGSILETWVLWVLVLWRPGVTSVGILSNASVLRVIRLLRLLRVIRISKVLAAFPEVVVLFKGMLVACRAVLSTLALIGVIIYMFSILFRQLSRGSKLEPLYFKSIPAAYGMLLVSSTAPDLASVFEDFLATVDLEMLCFSALFYVFILLISLTVLNLLIGILVNVVAEVANTEKTQMQERMLGDLIRRLMRELDPDCDDWIQRPEFLQMFSNPVVVSSMKNVGVDCLDVLDFVDVLFKTPDAVIPVDDLIIFTAKLRGGNVATVKDVIDSRRILGQEFAEVCKRHGLDASEERPLASSR